MTENTYINKFANSKFLTERLLAARAVDCYILEKLSKDVSELVRQSVVRNINCPIHILEELSKDNNLIVRCEVFLNDSCPINILDLHSTSIFWQERNNVACNINCNSFILKKIYDNESLLFLEDKYYKSFIINSIASNENCPTNILYDIFNKFNNSYESCYSLINNNKCPYDILKELYKKESTFKTKITQNPNWKLSEFE